MMGAGWQVASAQGMQGQRGMAQGERPQMDRPRAPLERALAMPGMQGRWWVNPRIVETLKISEDEQKALDGILIEHREKLIDLHAGLQKTELKLEELVEADKLDEAAITSQIDKVAQARAELEKANAHYLLAIWGMLTPEQRAQVKEYRSGQGPRYGWGQGQGQGQMRQRMMRPAPGALPPAAPVAPAAPESK